MINRKKAQEIILSKLKKNIVLKKNILLAKGYFLAQDIVAKLSQPPFDKAAMDGYTVCKNENKKRLFITNLIAAKKSKLQKTKFSETFKIMTGAPVPAGVGSIIPKEDVKESNSYIDFTVLPKTDNICYKGEDFKKGDILYKTGKLLDSVSIAVIKSSAIDTARVFKKTKVSILTTGDEVVEKNPQYGEIINSNKTLLEGLLGNNLVLSYHISDNKKRLKKAVKEALDCSDLIIITGGISKGDFDVVNETLTQMGGKECFNSVSIKPARPNTFFLLNEMPIFCFPGNPVAVFLSYLLFVKPSINYKAGGEFKIDTKEIKLNRGIRFNKSNRESFIPAFIQNGTVKFFDYSGPADLFTISKSNSFLIVPPFVERYKQNEVLEVIYY